MSVAELLNRDCCGINSVIFLCAVVFKPFNMPCGSESRRDWTQTGYQHEINWYYEIWLMVTNCSTTCPGRPCTRKTSGRGLKMAAPANRRGWKQSLSSANYEQWKLLEKYWWDACEGGAPNFSETFRVTFCLFCTIFRIGTTFFGASLVCKRSAPRKTEVFKKLRMKFVILATVLINTMRSI